MKKYLILAAFLVLVFASVFSVFGLTVTSPTGGWQNSKAIEFKLTAESESNFHYIADISSNKPWILLCKDTKECVKRVNSAPIKEGVNMISIKAVNSTGSTINQSIEVKIDSTKPVISEVSPKSGFATGNFTAKIIEENLNKTTARLKYKTAIGKIQDASTTCDGPENKKQNCSAYIDLDAYDGKEIVYWFEATDMAGNKAVSKKTSLKVDITKPVIKYSNFSSTRFSDKYDIATFILDIDEANFKNVSYQDNGSKWIVLCNSLKNGRCVAKAKFAKGEHDLIVRVSDKAGNTFDDTLSEYTFTI